jgi:hypothetical protein
MRDAVGKADVGGQLLSFIINVKLKWMDARVNANETTTAEYPQ